MKRQILATATLFCAVLFAFPLCAQVQLGRNVQIGVTGATGPTGPTGPPGTTGPPGPIAQFRGAWNNTTPYNINDAVSYAGSSYVALQANTGVTPDGGAPNWAVLAAQGGGGQGCGNGGDGECISSAPTLSQQIEQINTYFQLNAKNWPSAGFSAGAVDNCNFNSIPSGTANSFVQYSCRYLNNRGDYPGYSTQDNIENPWFVMSDFSINTQSSSAGIHNVFGLNEILTGIGDKNLINQYFYGKGGFTAYSDEGIVGHRSYLTELGELTGSVLTSVASGAATVVTDTCLTNCYVGVGHPVIDVSNGTADVISTTTLLAVGSMANQVNVLTVGNTYPVSTCGTVPNEVDIPHQVNNDAVVTTITVSTPSDLTPNVGQVFMPIATADKELITSVGTFNSGAHTQTITLPLRYSIYAGTAFCAGGAAGEWIERRQDRQGVFIYVVQVYGSPTANTLWVGDNGPGAVQAWYPTGTGQTTGVDLYQGGLVLDARNPVTQQADGGGFTITSSPGAFAAGHLFIHTNRVSQSWQQDKYALNVTDPFAIEIGNTVALGNHYNSAFSFIAGTQGTASSLASHGGSLYPPFGYQLGSSSGGGLNIFANGLSMIFAPEGGFINGQPTQNCVNCIGPIASGSTNTTYDYFDLLNGIGGALSATVTPASTMKMDFSGGEFQFNGSDVVTDANITAALPAVVPQVGTPTAGQAACIKAAGPPVVIGYCSTVVSSSGACTCN